MIQALELHGCMFPGPHCHMQIMTNGNALCSLINIVFQLFALSKPYVHENGVMYMETYQHLSDEIVIS